MNMKHSFSRYTTIILTSTEVERIILFLSILTIGKLIKKYLGLDHRNIYSNILNIFLLNLWENNRMQYFYQF